MFQGIPGRGPVKPNRNQHDIFKMPASLGGQRSIQGSGSRGPTSRGHEIGTFDHSKKPSLAN